MMGTGFALRCFAFSLSAAAALLSGCGGWQPPGAMPQALARRPMPASAANFFLENPNDIVEYDAKHRLVRTMSDGFQPNGVNTGSLAFDSAGSLYAITGYYTISVYARGSRTLVRTITTDVDGPNVIAIDAQDNLYVGNIFSGVAVFRRDSTAPAFTLEYTNDPVAIDFDAAGNIYVANLAANTVTVYSPQGELLKEITKGLRFPDAMVVDSKGYVFVASNDYGYGRGVVTVYAPKTYELIQTIHDGVQGPWSIAVDSKGRLYVSNENGALTTYSAATRKLVRTIAHTAGQDIIVDASENVYAPVGDPQSIDVYPPHALRARYTITKGVEGERALAIGPP
jgi:sugar lactone lactonase YvrE